MSIKKFYYIAEPTKWAKPPSVYSFSSLAQIENCPLAWQLQNSEYEGFARYPSKPVLATVEGELIHAVLEKVFRELARYGMPAIGSESFQKVLKRLAIVNLISDLVTKHQVKIADHPRGAGFRIKSSVQELHNKFIRIFKEQYCKVRNVTASSMGGLFDRSFSEISINKKLSHDLSELLVRNGVLTEVSLIHPDLPFKGIVDFVWLNDTGVVISDFKSGIIKSEHEEQLLLYAFLWEANTGMIPYKAYIVYPDSSLSIEITRDILRTVHTELVGRLKNAVNLLSVTPGKANVGNLCQYCQVRQMCDSYWKKLETTKDTFSQYRDIELIVSEMPSDFGFLGLSPMGDVINLVYEKDVAKISGPFVKGERLRILGGLIDGGAFELSSNLRTHHIS